VVSTLCVLLLYVALHQFSKLKERSTYLEAATHRDMTLLLLEPLAERCEMLKRGLTAVGLARRNPPYGAKEQAIEAECDAFLATRRTLQEQVRAASQDLDRLRGRELNRRLAALASLRQGTDQLIATMEKREAFRDTELQALKVRANP
jgi:hypothetical protein